MSDTTTQLKGKTMSYERACEILGYSIKKNLRINAEQAESALRTMPANAPLRFKVAASVLIAAAK